MEKIKIWVFDLKHPASNRQNVFVTICGKIETFLKRVKWRVIFQNLDDKNCSETIIWAEFKIYPKQIKHIPFEKYLIHLER